MLKHVQTKNRKNVFKIEFFIKKKVFISINCTDLSELKVKMEMNMASLDIYHIFYLSKGFRK